MPTNVLLWNVEEFGARFSDNVNARDFRTAMMAAIILDAEAQVVVLQEVRKGAFTDLQELVAALEMVGAGTNFRWNFDWLPGSITGTNSPGGIPTQAELDFCSQGNYEGYAVVYRTDLTPRPLAATPQAQSYGEGGHDNFVVEGNYIEIVSMGQTPQYNVLRYLAVDFDFNNINPTFPLNFPLHRDAPNLVLNDDTKNNGMFPRGLTRRPCVIYLNSAGGGAHTIVCLHSPAQSYSARIATQMAFGSAQFVQAQNGVGLGGDFNLDETRDRQGVGEQITFLKMPSNMNRQADNSYAGQPSSVNGVNWAKTAWLGQGGTDYLTSPRDIGAALLPGGQQAVPPVVFDPVDCLINGPHGRAVWNDFCHGGGSALITTALTGIAALTANIGTLGTGAQLVNGWMLNQQNQRPADSTNTTCVAYIVRQFLSDHSPVLMTFN